LIRTTNVGEVFPEKIHSPVIEFTLKELRSLDAGSWFNEQNPDRARDKFVGLKILTFEDVLKIAEGKRIKKVDGAPVQVKENNEWTGHYVYEIDPEDNGNRPGIYAETKKPDFEEILALELKELGWSINNNPKEIKTITDKVDVANTNGRFVLQSFSPESLVELEKFMPGIPKCFLLWHPMMADSLKENYTKAINFAIAQNVHFIGPSISGEPNNYEELTAPWMVELIHNSGISIHPYTFDTKDQLIKYGHRVEGVFTNRADLALDYYERLGDKSAVEILNDLGY
jgi:glycerophosphoryl diester phosphodiesterase